MALKGNLSQFSVLELLNYAEKIKFNGILNIKDKDNIFILHFKDGLPIDAKGDKTPIDSFKKFLGLKEGEFEFTRKDNITIKENEDLYNVYLNRENIIKRWDELKRIFKSLDLIFSFSSIEEKVRLSIEEWKILWLVNEFGFLKDILKKSPFGEFDTLNILSSLLNKKIIKIGENIEKKFEEYENYIPIKIAQWFEVNLSSLGGYFTKVSQIDWDSLNKIIMDERYKEFYERIDGKKSIKEIFEEMNLTLKEGEEILKFLTENGKISFYKKI